jgi:hypothetical protein
VREAHRARAQPAHVALDALVVLGEAVLVDQLLPDRLRVATLTLAIRPGEQRPQPSTSRALPPHWPLFSRSRLAGFGCSPRPPNVGSQLGTQPAPALQAPRAHAPGRCHRVPREATPRKPRQGRWPE